MEGFHRKMKFINLNYITEAIETSSELKKNKFLKSCSVLYTPTLKNVNKWNIFGHFHLITS